LRQLDRQELALGETELIYPAYTDSFRCIGSVCEDTCCQGWTIPIDQAIIQKYKNLPASPLHQLIDASIQLTPECADNSKPTICAHIQMNASRQCPLLSEDRLCRIQREYGEAFLPPTCATYPRIVYSIGNHEEQALALSCPEAARLVLLNPVLLNPVLLDPTLLSPSSRTIQEPLCDAPREGNRVEDSRSPQAWFWSIRKSVIGMIQNRAYPLWQRVFLVGVFCRQLEAIAQGECGSLTIPAYVGDFEAAVASGAPQAALDTLPVERALQLDLVLRLAGMLLHRSNLHPRFVECVRAFTSGIGNGPGATLESLTANYTLAHDRFYAPFFERHPHILENYLINAIFLSQFPFGREGMRLGASSSMAHEYALLTAQFALMKGLLIGVAGFHREAFSSEHVVHTVQSASKHFDHHRDFLSDAHALLVERQMDDARGAAILLRNTGSMSEKAA
jgi:lysine-N-methylase